jgi:hypothetical protein
MTYLNSFIFYQFIIFFILSNWVYSKSIYSKYDLISVNSLTVTGINNREVENYKCKQLDRKCTYPNYICIGNDNCYLVNETITKNNLINIKNNIFNCSNDENCFSNKGLPLTLCTVINNKYQCQRVNGERNEINNSINDIQKRDETNEPLNQLKHI